MSTDPDFNEEDVRFTFRFLGHEHETEVRLIDPNKKLPTKNLFAKSEDEFVKICYKYNGSYNVYAGINERKSGGTKKDDVISVNAICFDFDPVRDKTKPANEAELNLAREKALGAAEFLKRERGLYAIMGESGNGAQLWSKLHCEVTDANRDIVEENLVEWQRTIIELFTDEHVDVDNIADLPRVIKVIGTKSIKGEATPERPHRVSRWINRPTKVPEPDKIWSEALTVKRKSPARGTPTEDAEEQEDLNLGKIIEKCKWFKHCRKDSKNLTEREWLGMLGISARCKDGRKQSHLLSETYPSYNHTETERKIDHALKAGPQTCQYVRNNFPKEKPGQYCVACPHDITSPILLGRGKKKHRPAQSTKALPSGNSSFPLSDSEYVTWTPQEIRICRKTVAGQGDSRITIKNPPKPLRRLLVDGDTYFEYEFNGKSVTTKVDDLLHTLSSEGCVLFRQRAMDALSAVTVGMARETVRVHATYGVYDEDGKLRICERPHPVKPEQMRIWEQTADASKHEPTAEELYAYLEVLKHWHPYECMPFMGAGVASPFTPIIRGRRMLFPHLDAWSPERDLGKSLVTIIASTQLWSIETTTGPAIDSKFRFAYHLDSSCLSLAVEEADKLKPGLQSVTKESAERWVADERGTSDLDNIQYCARVVLMLSGNNIAFSLSAAQLKRCLIVRFDSTAKRFRKKGNKQLEEAVDNLAPVGYGLIRWWVQDHPSTDELVRSLREWKEQIRTARSAWGSPKRPEAWSCVYLGLKILEHGCKKLGLDWRAPTVELFVEKVAVPVEESTWAVERSNASRVASWLFKYTSEFKRTEKTWEVTRAVSRGEDETWRDAGDLVRVGGKTVPGRFMIDALLDTYNDQADDAFQVPSVIELTKQGADEAGIPYDQVLDSDMVRAKKVDFTGRKLRAAFIPDSLIGGESEAQLTVETGGELPGADGKGAHDAEWAEWFPTVPNSSQQFPTMGTTLSSSLDAPSLDISSQVPKKKECARIEGIFYKEALNRIRGNPMRPPSGVVSDIMCAHGLKPNEEVAVQSDVDAAFDDWVHS